jgi:hypothetical protein
LITKGSHSLTLSVIIISDSLNSIGLSLIQFDTIKFTVILSDDTFHFTSFTINVTRNFVSLSILGEIKVIESFLISKKSYSQFIFKKILSFSLSTIQASIIIVEKDTFLEFHSTTL